MWFGSGLLVNLSPKLRCNLSDFTYFSDPRYDLVMERFKERPTAHVMRYSAGLISYGYDIMFTE